jgi:hypothetical protein
MVIDVPKKKNSVTIALKNQKLPTIPQTFIGTVREFTQKRKPLIKYLASNSCIKSTYMVEENCFGVL